jgi:PTS system galactitol-specific IIA component
MDLRLIDLIHANTIVTHLSAADAEAVIQSLARRCIEAGYAEEGFAEDVIARERIYPTGLPTQPIGTAIPHADPHHILSSVVAVGLLDQPVSFGMMGTDGSVTVPAQAIFLLAIKETAKQVSLIQEVVRLLQSPDLLARLLAAPDPAAVHALLSAQLA